MAREVGVELLSRLDWMRLDPKVIIDLGCGPGEITQLLKKRYAKSLVIAIDLNEKMLDYASHQMQIPHCVCSDAVTLPFANQTIDFIVANMLLPWTDLSSVLSECRRILKPEGLFLFTSLGPDTLKDCDIHFDLPQRLDMHDIGDELLRLRFADPILDVDHYTISYKQRNQMMQELVATGVDVSEPYLAEGEVKAAATYEVIFGHAFAPENKSSDGIVKIPLSRLRKQFSNT